MEQRKYTMLSILLVVGLVIGAGAGYLLRGGSNPDYTSSSYITGYDDGWEVGFADGKASVAPEEVPDIEDSLSTVITLIYGAIGASLIAALAAIVTLMQVSRRVG